MKGKGVQCVSGKMMASKVVKRAFSRGSLPRCCSTLDLWKEHMSEIRHSSDALLW